MSVATLTRSIPAAPSTLLATGATLGSATAASHIPRHQYQLASNTMRTGYPDHVEQILVVASSPVWVHSLLDSEQPWECRGVDVRDRVGVGAARSYAHYCIAGRCVPYGRA